MVSVNPNLRQSLSSAKQAAEPASWLFLFGLLFFFLFLCWRLFGLGLVSICCGVFLCLGIGSLSFLCECVGIGFLTDGLL